MREFSKAYSVVSNQYLLAQKQWLTEVHNRLKPYLKVREIKGGRDNSDWLNMN
jgi:hypothetical protein